MFTLQPLESRRLLSVAGAIDGAAIAIKDSPYVLELRGSPIAENWVIDWGDGSTPQTVPATQQQVSHEYDQEFASLTIEAYLLEDGETTDDVDPALHELVVEEPSFGVYGSNGPHEEGQYLGLFVTDVEDLIEFQSEFAQAGDTYQVLWGDGTESDEIVLVDEDENGVVDPVEWTAGDLIGLHEYYSIDKAMTAVFVLTTQTDVYYSNAVRFDIKNPVAIETQDVESSGSVGEVLVTISRTQYADPGDIIVQLEFTGSAELDVDFSIQGAVHIGSGQVLIPENTASVQISLMSINGRLEDPNKSIELHYRGYIDETGDYTLTLNDDSAAWEHVWIMRKSGQKIKITDPNDTKLIQELNNAINANDPIINLSITGHGSGGDMYVGDNHFISVHNGAIKIFPKAGGAGQDITNLLNNALAANAQVNLQGCNTAQGNNSIAKQMSELLPGRAVWGSTGKCKQVWRNSVVPWSGSKVFRDGEEVDQ